MYQYIVCANHSRKVHNTAISEQSPSHPIQSTLRHQISTPKELPHLLIPEKILRVAEAEKNALSLPSPHCAD